MVPIEGQLASATVCARPAGLALVIAVLVIAGCADATRTSSSEEAADAAADAVDAAADAADRRRDSAAAWLEDAGRDAGATRDPESKRDAETAVDAESFHGSDAAPSTDESARDTTLVEKPPALADQTPPTMVNGIAIDDRGYLWVAAGAQSQLLRLEPPGQNIVGRYATMTPLDGPDDLVVTQDAVYYTAMAAGTVNRLDRLSKENAVLGTVGIGVNPIVLTEQGKLLVGLAPGPVPALAPLFTGLFELDRVGGNPRRVLRDSRSINAFCVAPDGFVYGPTESAVLRIDLTTNTSTIVHDGFGYAGAVRYNRLDRRLYVLDVSPSENRRIAILYRMELDGSAFAVFARMSAVAGESYTADNFAIADDGTFYVTRLYEAKITRVSADGARVEDFAIGER